MPPRVGGKDSFKTVEWGEKGRLIPPIWGWGMRESKRGASPSSKIIFPFPLLRGRGYRG